MKITRSNYREEVVADLMDAINETAFILALGMTVDLDDNGITINEEHSLAYPFIRHDLEVLVEKAGDIWTMEETAPLRALVEGR